MKLAVLGLGFMGTTHLKALKNIPQAELVAVASDIPEQLTGDLSSIQGNLGGPGEKFDFSEVRKYGNVHDAVRDPGVEAVDICLPTFLHAPVAIAALRAGKHVIVEKPMALTGAEADQMIQAAEEAKRVLMVAQVLRFFPAYIPLMDRVRSGSLGQVRSALFRRRCSAPGWGKWIPDSSKSGGGIFDLLIHDVDMCLHLFGKPEAVSAVGYENMPAGIDFIGARFHYPSIGAVVVTGGWHHPKSYPFSMEFTVTADGGTIEYSSAGRPVTLYRADGEQEALPQPECDGYEAEIAYFLECAANGRKPERCLPQDSAAATKLALLMVEARKSNGKLVECRL